MKTPYSSLLTFLAVIITEGTHSVLSVPTPVFAPFTIAFQNVNQGSQQRLPQTGRPPGPQLRPVSEIFYAITRGPNDPPPRFASGPALEYHVEGGQNQVAGLPAVVPPQPSIIAAQPPGPPPAQEPHLQAQEQGISGPPPMPSLPFHTVPATLPNTPPFEWHATTTQAVPHSTTPTIPSPTVSLHTLEPVSHTLAPSLENTVGDSVDGTTPVVRERSRRLSGLPIVGIVLGTLGGLTLLIFMLLDPRISRACRTKRLNTKGLGTRPISSWFPCQSAHQHNSFTPVSRKAVTGQRRGLELENSENSVHASLATSCPRSKFSITSSDYDDQMSRASMSTTDTVLVENTRANESIPPIRPPRPPTADSPATISDSVFFAPENQLYLEPLSPSKGVDDDQGKREGGLALGRPLIPPGAFFTRPLASGSLSSTSTAVASATVNGGLSALQQRRHGVLGHFAASNSGLGGSESMSGSESDSRMNYNFTSSGGLYSTLGLLQFGSTSDTLSTGEESRHSRRHSAPLFTGNPVDDSCKPVYMDPVARKVLKHRRSRSNSGWAYPRRTVANPSFQWSSESEESYHGAYGQAL